MTREADLERIDRALVAAGGIAARIGTEIGTVIGRKERNDPVTEADLAIDARLKEILPSEGEGWLSEESVDDPARLGARRVWVVDPLDGTKEYAAGIPEWCISVGLVEEGEAVAGGIYNPATGEKVVGSRETGVTLNGAPVKASGRTSLDGAVVLASRSEIERGQWDRYKDAPFRVEPKGSVAYKLGLVAAGRADATWSLAPKHEWDVAAGVALIRAAGGAVGTLGGEPIRFNRPKPWLPDLYAAPAGLVEKVRELLRND